MFIDPWGDESHPKQPWYKNPWRLQWFALRHPAVYRALRYRTWPKIHLFTRAA